MHVYVQLYVCIALQHALHQFIMCTTGIVEEIENVSVGYFRCWQLFWGTATKTWKKTSNIHILFEREELISILKKPQN